MGKSSRSNRRRREANSVAHSRNDRYTPRRTPYNSWQKKFSALRAPEYTFQGRRPKQQRSTYGKSINSVRVIKRIRSNVRRSSTNPYAKLLTTKWVNLDGPRRVIRGTKIVSECVRRGIREQVMHALGKTGKTGQKTPKWTLQSRKRCK